MIDFELARGIGSDMTPNVGAYCGLTASLIAFLSSPVATEVVIRWGSVRSASRLNVTEGS